MSEVLMPIFEPLLSEVGPILPEGEQQAKSFLAFFCILALQIEKEGNLWSDIVQLGMIKQERVLYCLFVIFEYSNFSLANALFI